MSMRRRLGHHGAEQDFELNIASIIDCFVVLIAFLLVATSFVSIGILDAEVAASGEEVTEPAERSPVQLVIDLKADKTILVQLSGELNRVHKISPKSKEWNYDALTDRLAIVKGEWPALKSVVLMADNRVDYRDVIKSMEIARLAVPSVHLGGF